MKDIFDNGYTFDEIKSRNIYTLRYEVARDLASIQDIKNNSSIYLGVYRDEDSGYNAFYLTYYEHNLNNFDDRNYKNKIKIDMNEINTEEELKTVMERHLMRFQTLGKKVSVCGQIGIVMDDDAEVCDIFLEDLNYYIKWVDDKNNELRSNCWYDTMILFSDIEEVVK